MGRPGQEKDQIRQDENDQEKPENRIQNRPARASPESAAPITPGRINMHAAADNIGNEGTFMYCYFAESDPNAVGYMVCVNGTEIGTVMDTEAVHIFQEYVRQYWYSDMEMVFFIQKTSLNHHRSSD